MAIETIKKSALTDIANAIGIQNGGTDTYPPSEMAAVLALDDVKEGAPFQAVDTSDAGVISDFVFDAIKAQSRLIKTTHPTRCPPGNPHAFVGHRNKNLDATTLGRDA